jgi:hypothetical protein
LFTNNTSIFNGVDPDHLGRSRCLFLCFEAIVSLKVSLAKLELVSVSDVADEDGLVGIMGLGVFFLAFEVSWSFVGCLL